MYDETDEVEASKLLAKNLGAVPIPRDAVFAAEYEILQNSRARKSRPQPRKTWARGLKDAARANDGARRLDT